MKNLFTTVIVGLSAFAPALVMAASDPSPINTPGVGSGVPVTIDAFYTIACQTSNWVFAFVILLGVISLLGGAVAFLTSRGDEDQVASARRYITYSLVGVAVAVLSRSLIFVVGNFIGIENPATEFFAC